MKMSEGSGKKERWCPAESVIETELCFERDQRADAQDMMFF